MGDSDVLRLLRELGASPGRVEARLALAGMLGRTGIGKALRDETNDARSFMKWLGDQRKEDRSALEALFDHAQVFYPSRTLYVGINELSRHDIEVYAVHRTDKPLVPYVIRLDDRLEFEFNELHSERRGPKIDLYWSDIQEVEAVVGQVAPWAVKGPFSCRDARSSQEWGKLTFTVGEIGHPMSERQFNFHLESITPAHHPYPNPPRYEQNRVYTGMPWNELAEKMKSLCGQGRAKE